MIDSPLKRRSLVPADFESDEAHERKERKRELTDEERSLLFTRAVAVLQLLIVCAGVPWLWLIVGTGSPSSAELAQLALLLLPLLSFALVWRSPWRSGWCFPFLLLQVANLLWASDDFTLTGTLDLSTGLVLLHLVSAGLSLWWFVTHRIEGSAFWAGVIACSGFYLGPVAVTMAQFLAAS